MVVAEVDFLHDALAVEPHCELLQIEIELHVFKQVLADLIGEQHDELVVLILEHFEGRVFFLEGQLQQFLQEVLTVVHDLDRRSDP